MLVVHGDLDVLAPVEEARLFAERLRDLSDAPVVYVELAGAQHAFEMFHSMRALHTVSAVDAFLAWLLSRDGKSTSVAIAAAASADGTRVTRSATPSEWVTLASSAHRGGRRTGVPHLEQHVENLVGRAEPAKVTFAGTDRH